MTTLVEAEKPTMNGLREIVAQSDPAILLASLVCTTGETDRIAQFAPHISSAVDKFSVRGQLPRELQNELEEWAVDVISRLEDFADDRDPRLLGDDDFLALARKLTVIPVEREQLPFLRDQGGFTPLPITLPRTRKPRTGFSLLVVGAGMAGITAAIAASRSGFDVEVLEKNAGVGGVWWQNRYPGVGVDTHSKYYSLSFAINPEWTNSHPEGDEFREYLEGVAKENEVYDKITFNAEVTAMEWDDEAGHWTVTYVQDGTEHQVTATAVLTAAGYLTRPVLPQVPGVDTFSGESFHSAEWRDDYDFTGKRVAVIGTGCTSVQIVDSLAPVASSITLFQRQPHWVGPSAGDSTVPEPERWLLMNVPTYKEWARLQMFLITGDVNYAAVRYDEDWARTHDRSISEANHRGMEMMLAYLEESFSDRPDLKQALTPDFAFMGKRPVRDPGSYYATLKKDSTTLVNGGLVEVRPEGPVAADGTLHEVDVIVYATGFTLEYLSHWDIIGRDGQKLRDVWGDTPEAYLGCQVPGFPNLFVTSGPNANPSHGGAHNFCVEAVVHYAVESLQTLVETDSRSIEPTPEAQAEWIAEIRDKLADSIWGRETRANTYYRNAKGEVLLASPLTMQDYWERLREPDLTKMRLE
ncbi:flavin-containing monooxygenase [Microbacterium sp. AGC85]